MVWKATAELEGIRAEGMHGPMSTDMFMDTVMRNAWRPDRLRFMVNVFWGTYQGAPKGTVTLVVGKDDGNAYNIPTPSLPEYSLVEANPYAADFDAIKMRGWRPLFQMLISDFILRPNNEIRSLLGDQQFKDVVESPRFRERVKIKGRTRSDIEAKPKKRKVA